MVAGWLHIPEKTGPFVFTIVALVAASTVMGTRLRPDPLLLARSVRAEQEAAEDRAGRGRPAVGVIRHTPLVLAAAVGMALSHAVMVSVMVMTPIHMDHGGASLEVIGLVISGHILGMFAFSPLVGMLADRVGSPLVVGIGGLILLTSLVLSGLSAPGASPGSAFGLFLLGLGWSFGTVGSSTLLVAATPARHRPRVQGTVDMTTGFTAAAGGAVAGIVVGDARVRLAQCGRRGARVRGRRGQRGRRPVCRPPPRRPTRSSATAPDSARPATTRTCPSALARAPLLQPRTAAG